MNIEKPGMAELDVFSSIILDRKDAELDVFPSTLLDAQFLFMAVSCSAMISRKAWVFAMVVLIFYDFETEFLGVFLFVFSFLGWILSYQNSVEPWRERRVGVGGNSKKVLAEQWGRKQKKGEEWKEHPDPTEAAKVLIRASAVACGVTEFEQGADV